MDLRDGELPEKTIFDYMYIFSRQFDYCSSGNGAKWNVLWPFSSI